ncbi:MAG: NYN domain-containing protein [Anaerolineales bacterium]|nr:NYN domain-containing protein [Anaerolineales bacterium]
MPYLIDGHNLIPKLPGLSLRNIDDEVALIERLQAYAQRTGKKVEVFFDGAPPGNDGTRKYGNITAHFVRVGTTADSAIRLYLLRMKGAAKNWVVVSSDRQVQAEARGVRAQVLPSEEFAKDFLKPVVSSSSKKPRQEEKLSPTEVAEWLALFKQSDPSDFPE